MAHVDTISHDFLIKVAQEIGRLIDARLSNDREIRLPDGSDAFDVVDGSTPLRLAETLQVWKLQDKAYEYLANSGLSGDIVDWVVPTNALHHQLRLRGIAAGFVRSRLEPEVDKPVIVQFNTSPLAARINDLFVVIESNEQQDPIVDADPVVRLLEIPAYHVLALWLFAESAETEKKSRSVIISAPQSYKKWPGPFMNSENFFAALKEGGAILNVA